MPDSEIMFKIRQLLAEEFKDTKLLRGVIYLRDISGSRIGGVAKKVGWIVLLRMSASDSDQRYPRTSRILRKSSARTISEILS